VRRVTFQGESDGVRSESERGKGRTDLSTLPLTVSAPPSGMTLPSAQAPSQAPLSASTFPSVCFAWSPTSAP